MNPWKGGPIKPPTRKSPRDLEWEEATKAPIKKKSPVVRPPAGKKPEPNDLLLKIDNGPMHSLPLNDVGPQEKPVLDELVRQRLINLVPAKGRFPEHYSLTGGGSHALHTFTAAMIQRVAARYTR